MLGCQYVYISGDLHRVSFGTLKARILPTRIGNKFLSEDNLRMGIGSYALRAFYLDNIYRFQQEF
jgi:hypothetical protein